MTLEEILQKSFGCKKVFPKKKKLTGYNSEGITPEPCYEYLTKSGGIAYDKLVDLLYGLGDIFGKGFNADHWIDELDKIVDSDEYL